MAGIVSAVRLVNGRNGRVQHECFGGGNLRLGVQHLWELAPARAHIARCLRVGVQGRLPPVAELVTASPARRIDTDDGPQTQGVAVRLQMQMRLTAAQAEIDLGDDGRIWPSDEALERWRAAAAGREAEVVYE